MRRVFVKGGGSKLGFRDENFEVDLLVGLITIDACATFSS
jgi:hypothetical protein